MIADLFSKLFGYLGKFLLALLNFFKDTFGGIFDVLWRAIKWIGKLIWNAVKWLGDVLWDVIKWLGKLLVKLFQSLIDVLVAFFQVIYDVIKSIMYLFYQIGVLAYELFMVILMAAKMLYSLILGFFRTLGSLVYTPRSSGGNGYSEMLGKIMNATAPLQLDVVAYILLFIIWLTTAIAAIKMISSIRVGGD